MASTSHQPDTRPLTGARRSGCVARSRSEGSGLHSPESPRVLPGTSRDTRRSRSLPRRQRRRRSSRAWAYSEHNADLLTWSRGRAASKKRHHPWLGPRTRPGCRSTQPLRARCHRDRPGGADKCKHRHSDLVARAGDCHRDHSHHRRRRCSRSHRRPSRVYPQRPILRSETRACRRCRRRRRRGEESNRSSIPGIAA
jgi:hypothetical protein